MRKLLLDKAEELGIEIHDKQAPLYQIEEQVKAEFRRRYFERYNLQYLAKSDIRKELSRMIYCTVSCHHPDKASLEAERVVVANDVDSWVADVPLHSGSTGVWLPKAIVDNLRERKYVRRVDYGVNQEVQDGKKFIYTARNTPGQVLQNEFTIQEITPPKELIDEIKTTVIKAQSSHEEH